MEPRDFFPSAQERFELALFIVLLRFFFFFLTDRDLKEARDFKEATPSEAAQARYPGPWSTLSCDWFCGQVGELSQSIDSPRSTDSNGVTLCHCSRGHIETKSLSKRHSPPRVDYSSLCSVVDVVAPHRRSETCPLTQLTASSVREKRLVAAWRRGGPFRGRACWSKWPFLPQSGGWVVEGLIYCWRMSLLRAVVFQKRRFRRCPFRRQTTCTLRVTGWLKELEKRATLKF